jgi:hypothetical protein
VVCLLKKEVCSLFSRLKELSEASFLFFRQHLGHVDDVSDQQVAELPVLFKDGHAFASVSLHQTRLRYFAEAVDFNDVVVQMPDLSREAKQGFLESNVHSSLEIVAFSLKHWVTQLRHLDDNGACTHVQVFISRVFVLHLVAVWSALFNEDSEGIDTVDELLPPADVASRCDDLALAFAFFTLLLELLYKTWRDLLLFDHDSLPVALCARLDVFGIVTAASSAVRADNLPVVLHFVVFTRVEFF